MLLMAILMVLPSTSLAFTSKHLVLQGQGTNGCGGGGGAGVAIAENASSFWVEMYNAATSPEYALHFDNVACPANKAEEHLAIQNILNSAGQNDDVLIVAGVVQEGWCFSANAADCIVSDDADRFGPYAQSLQRGMTHIWIEGGPAVVNGSNASVTSALAFYADGTLAVSISLKANDFRGGELLGREFCRRAELTAPQVVVALKGETGASHSDARIDGFGSYIAAHCSQHRIAYTRHANWQRDQAESIATSLFLSDSYITAFVCANDDMALGVLDAASSRPGGGGGLIVMGYDHVTDINSPVRDGRVPATINQQTSDVSSGLLYSLSDLTGILERRLQAGHKMTTFSVNVALDLLSFATVRWAVAIMVTNMEEHLFRELLNAAYDPASRPPGVTDDNTTHLSCSQSGATVVYVDQFITSLLAVDQEAQTYSLDGYLRLRWLDSRLSFKHLLPATCQVGELHLRAPRGLWLPDVYFPNATSAVSPFAADDGETLVTIDPLGWVMWSRRIRQTLQCGQEFTYLPFDNQTCEYRLESYSEIASRVEFRWFDPTEPFSGVEHLSNPQAVRSLSQHVEWDISAVIATTREVPPTFGEHGIAPPLQPAHVALLDSIGAADSPLDGSNIEQHTTGHFSYVLSKVHIERRGVGLIYEISIMLTIVLILLACLGLLHHTSSANKDMHLPYDLNYFVVLVLIAVAQQQLVSGQLPNGISRGSGQIFIDAHAQVGMFFIIITAAWSAIYNSLYQTFILDTESVQTTSFKSSPERTRMRNFGVLTPERFLTRRAFGCGKACLQRNSTIAGWISTANLNRVDGFFKLVLASFFLIFVWDPIGFVIQGFGEKSDEGRLAHKRYHSDLPVVITTATTLTALFITLTLPTLLKYLTRSVDDAVHALSSIKLLDDLVPASAAPATTMAKSVGSVVAKTSMNGDGSATTCMEA